MDTFGIKTIVKFGLDALSYLETLKGKKVFLITDPFMVKSGLVKKVTRYFAENRYEIFSDIVPDPPMEVVAQGVTAIGRFQPEVVVALGGGSAIDAAKAIMDLSKSINGFRDLPFIAIPTTSGTGSEVTSFAVITDKQKGIKYPMVSDELLPDIAILDVELVKTLPSSIVADTGMDVLTHAIEAYVSTKATDFSDALAEKAVKLVFQYLKRSYQSEDDREAREKMHYASCLAGLAFNMASLGLNHAMAHNMGGRLRLPHGRNNAILLPYIIAFNANIQSYHPEDYTRAAKKYAYLATLLGAGAVNVRNGVKNLIAEVVKLQKQLKIPRTLRECNVNEAEVKALSGDIAQGALEDSCILTNPRNVTKLDIVHLLHEIL